MLLCAAALVLNCTNVFFFFFFLENLSQLFTDITHCLDEDSFINRDDASENECCQRTRREIKKINAVQSQSKQTRL